MLVEHGARIEDNDIEGVRPVDLHPVSLITPYYFSATCPDKTISD